jgi:hypothetical protein
MVSGNPLLFERWDDDELFGYDQGPALYTLASQEDLFPIVHIGDAKWVQRGFE